MQDSEWLPLVKDVYYSQEKGPSLLLNKRIRKTEEHALHDSTNTVDSRYLLYLFVIWFPYIRKTANS